MLLGNAATAPTSRQQQHHTAVRTRCMRYKHTLGQAGSTAGAAQEDDQATAGKQLQAEQLQAPPPLNTTQMVAQCMHGNGALKQQLLDMAAVATAAWQDSSCSAAVHQLHVMAWPLLALADCASPCSPPRAAGIWTRRSLCRSKRSPVCMCSPVNLGLLATSLPLHLDPHMPLKG